jgi:hypothetical protein
MSIVEPEIDLICKLNLHFVGGTFHIEQLLTFYLQVLLYTIQQLIIFASCFPLDKQFTSGFPKLDYQLRCCSFVFHKQRPCIAFDEQLSGCAFILDE